MSYCDTCCHKYSDICGTCETLDGVPIKYSKITNADKIRHMTDEEIAKAIVENASLCPNGRIYRETECDVLSCYDCWLEWLKQEVKE